MGSKKSSAGAIYLDLVIRGKIKEQAKKASKTVSDTMQKGLDKVSSQMEAVVERNNKMTVDSVKKALDKAAKYQKSTAEKVASNQQKVTERAQKKQLATAQKAQEKLKKLEQERQAFKEQTDKDIAAAMDRYRQRVKEENQRAVQPIQEREPTRYHVQKSSTTPKSEVTQDAQSVKDTKAVKKPAMLELGSWKPAQNALDLLQQKLDVTSSKLSRQGEILQELQREYAKVADAQGPTSEAAKKLDDMIQKTQSSMISLQNTALQTENKILQMEQAPIRAAEKAAAAQEKAKQREIAAAERAAQAQKRAAERAAAAQQKAQEKAVRAQQQAFQRLQSSAKSAYGKQAVSSQASAQKSTAAQTGAIQRIKAAFSTIQSVPKAAFSAITSGVKKVASGFSKITKLVAKFSLGMKKSTGGVQSFGARLRSIVGGALIFNGISRALTSMTTYFKNAVMSSGQFRDALANLKGAAATAAAPIIQALTPALAALANAAATVFSYISRLFSLLTGKSVASMQSAAKATGAYAQSVSDATNAAKDLAKAQNTLGIDELNVVNQDDKSSTGAGGGSAGAAGSEILPNYDFEGRFQGLETALQRVKQLIADIGKLFAPSIKAWGDAFASLRDTAVTVWAVMKQSALDLWQNGLAPLGSYILQQFIPSIVNGFSQTFAPIVADVGSVFLNGFALFVQTGCQIISQSINDLVLPLLQYLQTVFLDMLNGIAQAWAQYGQPIMDGISQAFQNISDVIVQVYNSIIKPILDEFMGQITALWTDHFKPLWDNLMQFFGAFGEMVLAIWNNYLMPWVKNMTDVLTPIITGVFKILSNTLGAWFSTAADIVNAVITVFKGLCQFVTGVLQGDWEKAWNGVKTIFQGVWDGIKAYLKGAINSVINLINGMLQAVESGLNFVIAKLNTLSIDVPDWVPNLGGKSFGFDIPSVSVPKIPMLANGGVITQPTLAMMGEYAGASSNPEIVAPESKIRALLAESVGDVSDSVNRLIALLEYQARRSSDAKATPIQIKLDSQVLYRAMVKVEQNQGVKIGGAFANAY